MKQFMFVLAIYNPEDGIAFEHTQFEALDEDHAYVLGGAWAEQFLPLGAGESANDYAMEVS